MPRDAIAAKRAFYYCTLLCSHIALNAHFIALYCNFTLQTKSMTRLYIPLFAINIYYSICNHFTVLQLILFPTISYLSICLTHSNSTQEQQSTKGSFAPRAHQLITFSHTLHTKCSTRVHFCYHEYLPL